ncbi:MAG TPA: GntR family transcriptional regulator [Candidatus Acidoferrales bacterium]|nr:GntR family transcriptional regulator [Candidatus Acidoferrales bacterium]
MHVPTYIRVADTLEEQIAAAAPGALLASEHELAREYDVSRHTARAALEELERRFLVRRAQGRGTFVAERIDYRIGPGTVPSWSESVRRSGGRPRSVTETLRMRRGDAQTCAALELPLGTQVVYLARRRYLDDRVAAYAQTWLAADLVPDLQGHLDESGSLHEVLRDVYGLQPQTAKSLAEFVVAPAVIAQRVGQDGRPVIFKLESTVVSERHARPLQATQSWLRADMFRVVFEMNR